MFVRCKKWFKDGKEHRYWSVVENVRVSRGRVVQRQVLYLGEINDSQRAAWWSYPAYVELCIGGATSELAVAGSGKCADHDERQQGRQDSPIPCSRVGPSSEFCTDCCDRESCCPTDCD